MRWRFRVHAYMVDRALDVTAQDVVNLVLPADAFIDWAEEPSVGVLVLNVFSVPPLDSGARSMERDTYTLATVVT